MDRDQLPEELLMLAGKTDGTGNESEKWLPVWMHLEDTAGIMDMLIKKWLPGSVITAAGFRSDEADIFQRLCKFIAYVHDIGKFTPAFASKIYSKLIEMAQYLSIVPSSEEMKFASYSPHALAGKVILTKEGCPEEIAIIVGAHHGKPQSLQYGLDDVQEQMLGYKSNYVGPKHNRHPDTWENIWKSWITYALNKTDFSSMEEMPELSMEAQVIITGLLITADWIASNPCYFPLLELDMQGNKAFYPGRIENAWRKLQFPAPWKPECFAMDRNIFENRFGFLPNEVQESVISAVNDSTHPGIYILEAQMGVGKTEAALASAEVLAKKYKNDGIFFGLPTQATANGIFGRLEEWAISQSDDSVHAIRLAHGMAELNDYYRELLEGTSNINENENSGGLIVHEWFGGKKTSLLADFVIGTVDQVLMAALKQKHVMLRHLGLCGKIVIIDECHAYDAYMNQYLDRALNWLGAYHIPVIMLSATLPEERRRELIQAYQYSIGKEKAKANIPENWEKSRQYPLLTWTDGSIINQTGINMRKTEKKVNIDFIHDRDVISTLNQALKAGGCAGLIVNTVKRAQIFADLIRRNMKDVTILVFHAQFTMSDRAEKEQILLKRIGKKSTSPERNRVIVIGTQVLEQSLDIDFDYLITDLCPMDLLLQRIGRLHRHIMRKRPEALLQAHCAVIDGENGQLEEGSCAIYGEWLLSRTRQLLKKEIVLPDDIPQLVQDTYEKLDETVKNAAWEEYCIGIKKKKKKAKEFCVPAPQKRDNFKSHHLTGWLDADLDDSDVEAKAAVRDGDDSIEVILMKKISDGKTGFVSAQYCGKTVDSTRVPDADTSRIIASQRIRLPHMFVGVIYEIIEELQKRNQRECPEWQQSKLLRGELFLLLDEENCTELCGFHITYNESDGLICSKGEIS